MYTACPLCTVQYTTYVLSVRSVIHLCTVWDVQHTMFTTQSICIVQYTVWVVYSYRQPKDH